MSGELFFVMTLCAGSGCTVVWTRWQLFVRDAPAVVDALDRERFEAAGPV